MAVVGLFLLSLFWHLVYCQQTFPYVSFMGQTLANHSYVDLSLVGSGSNSVQCHTDLNTCCSGAQGSNRGDWYFPNGHRLPLLIFSDDSVTLSEVRTAQKVDIYCIRDTGPTGIYHCAIETVAVHGNGMREIVHVGLYTSDEGMCDY